MEPEIWYDVPEYTVNWIGDRVPQSETIPRYVSLRGDLEEIKKLTGNGKGIKVGVCDTGVSKEHGEGDLKFVTAKSFVPGESWVDKNGHGGHCTCTIGAREDKEGIRGLAPEVELYHAKVLSNRGSGASSWIAAGIRWCISQGCDVISLSLGGSFSSDIEAACKEADEKGIIVVAAMGNSGNRGAGHPGTSKWTLGIAAMDYDFRVADFSSRANNVDYIDFGVSTLSCHTLSRYVRLSGTSMATPCVAGICALLLGYFKKIKKPVVSRIDFTQRVKDSLVDIGARGRDRAAGKGFIDLMRVIENNPPSEPFPVEPIDPPTDPVEPPKECPNLEVVGEITFKGDKYKIIKE